MKFIAALTVVISFATGITAFSCTCGSNAFTNTDITNAVNKGYSLLPNPTTSSGSYPHLFNNREALLLPWCGGAGPYVEYPLKAGSAYTTSSPGADRAIYLRGSTKTFCGCITHTGASGSNFVLCSNKS